MLEYHGVTFNNVRKALAYLYYGKDFLPEVAYKKIIPMQQNFFNPIELGGTDTYIQYFIEDDEKITQDQFGITTNFTYKFAEISLRFVGASAEMWAKAFHHLTKRADTYPIFMGTCQAEKLESDGNIVPMPVTLNGKNVHIAFDTDFRLFYKESIDIDNWEALAKVQLAPGLVFKSGGYNEL